MKKLSGQTELQKNLENLQLTDEMIELHGRNKIRNQFESKKSVGLSCKDAVYPKYL